MPRNDKCFVDMSRMVTIFEFFLPCIASGDVDSTLDVMFSFSRIRFGCVQNSSYLINCSSLPVIFKFLICCFALSAHSSVHLRIHSSVKSLKFLFKFSLIP